MIDVAVGMQPIVDNELKIFAHEILFRGKFENGKFNNSLATFYNLNILINNYNLNKLIGNHYGFINIDEEILNSEILYILDPNRFVLEILETVIINDKIKNKIEEFKRIGFKIALDDFIGNEEHFENYKKEFELFDFIKFDISESDKSWIEKNIDKFKNIILFSEKVEKVEDYIFYKNLGFSLFQGYFFAKPQIKRKKVRFADKINIINLISIDDVDELIKGIKSDPNLTISLLKYVNSAAFLNTSKIESVSKAVMRLGVKNLKRWLMLSLYTIGSTSDIDPLIELVKQRANFLSQIAKLLHLDEEKAFLVGILSMINLISEESIEEILELIKADSDLKDALLLNRGFYAEILKLSILKEKDDKKYIDILEKLQIDEKVFNKIYLDALMEGK